jgi:POT family proton-dependent oligopeptide transporter
MPKILRVISLGIADQFSLSSAEPKAQMEKHGREVPWDEEFVAGVRSALVACQIW